MDSKHELLGVIGLIAAGLTLVFAIVVTMAYFEAHSYRRYCDKPVTTWDAIWLDLRIDECVPWPA